MRYASLLVMAMLLLPISLDAQEIGEAAPDFDARLVDDSSLRLSDLRGKVVLLDFWASWCGPCRRELPFLVKLHREINDSNFVILAVNIDSDRRKMAGFLRKLDLQLPFVSISDPEQKIPPLYRLETMPTTLLIDEEGIVRYRHAGYEDSEQEHYRREVRELLGRKQTEGAEK